MSALLAILLLGCTEPEPEPAAVEVHQTLDQAVALAERGTAIWPSEELALGWIESVWMFGLHRLHQASGDERWQTPYRDWLEARSGALPESVVSSDTLSPAILASALMIEDPSVERLDYVEAADAYLAEVPRTDEGAIVHWSQDTAFVDDDEIWIDSQFMFGMYLLREHERTGDRAPLDLFVEQYTLFSELCRDEATQLYRHAYDDGTDSNIPEEATFWARGNSWVLVAGAEALSLVDEDDPAHAALAPLVRAHAEALLATQAVDGLWHTVLDQPRGDDPANYTETSAAALLGYGLLRASETVLSPDAVRPALDALVDGLQERITSDDEGLHVEGTSFGTNPGDYDYYVAVPVLDDQLLGFAAVVMFLAEVDGEPLGGG